MNCHDVTTDLGLDEAYAIIDAIDSAEKKRNLDEEKINEFLKKCAPVSA